MHAIISILIADSQYLIRAGLRQLTASVPGLIIVGEAEDRQQLREQLEEHHPDIVIIDYLPEETFGMAAVRMIKDVHPRAAILVISADNEKNSIFQVLELGVQSFLTKTCGEEEILDAIRATYEGEKFFCTKVIDYLLEKSFSKDSESSCAPTPLSAREIEIVQLIAQGFIAKEIAGRLNLSTHTVYTHRKNIMKKLSLNSSSELVLYAVNNGMIDAVGANNR